MFNIFFYLVIKLSGINVKYEKNGVDNK
jgi:hypothetical protein